MRRRKMFREGVEWIALEDNPGDDEPAESLRGYMTVALLADLTGYTVREVSEAVVRYRRDHAEPPFHTTED